jgi:hypothetical protein
MQVTIIAIDEFTGIEVDVVVNDATSTGIPSAQKCAEMLEQQQARYSTLFRYKSHSVKAW